MGVYCFDNGVFVGGESRHHDTFFAKMTDPNEKEDASNWQDDIFIFTTFTDFCLYIGVVYYSKQLYDELRLNYEMAEAPVNQANNPFFGGGGYGRQQNAAPAANAQQQGSGYIWGTGQRLGGA